MGKQLTTAELKQHGTFRRDRHDAAMPARGTIGEAPASFSEVERQVWFTIIDSIDNLAEVDELTLTGACQWYARWLEAMNDKTGNVYKTTTIAAMCWKQFSTCSAKLGLSPSDRQKLRTTANTASEDELKFFGT